MVHLLWLFKNYNFFQNKCFCCILLFQQILLKVLGILLRIKAKKQVVSESFCENFIKKTEEDLHDLRHMIDREKEEEEEVNIRHSLF